MKEEDGTGSLAVGMPCRWGKEEVPTEECDKDTDTGWGSEYGLRGGCLAIYGTRGS